MHEFLEGIVDLLGVIADTAISAFACSGANGGVAGGVSQLMNGGGLGNAIGGFFPNLPGPGHHDLVAVLSGLSQLLNGCSGSLD